MSQCTAKSKRSGEQCRVAAMHGRNVCYHHGGATPRGHALPQTIHGRYSKDLPTRLAARFAETEHDPELLSLRQDIRLLDVLLQDDLARLDADESGAAWEAMRLALVKLEEGLYNKQMEKVQTGLNEMRDVVNKRILHYATEVEIRSKLEQRRKLVETENRMLLAGEQAITIEQAMLLVGALAGILKAHIHDAPTLTKIQADIGLLISASEVAR